MSTDSLRERIAVALRAAYNAHGTADRLPQMVSYGTLADAALSVRDEELADAQQHDAQCKRVWDQYPQALDRLRQLRAYARWCTAHSVEPEARDILELADGAHRDDYVALMAEGGGE